MITYIKGLLGKSPQLVCHQQYFIENTLTETIHQRALPLWRSYSNQDSVATGRRVDQWHRIQSPEISSDIHNRFSGGQDSPTGESTGVTIKGAGAWTATRTTMKLDSYLTPHTNINSKWIKVLS